MNLTSDTELWISRQVIREYLVQATHPRTFVTLPPIQQIASQVEIILSLFHVADDTAEVTTQLLALLQEFPTSGKQIHDVNIVASLLVYGVDTLATLNIEDMKRFKPRIDLLSIGEAST